ncbi:anti-sigma factor antagonist [Micromonospora acroterricola]|uniref:Anti-sigma factor antagonist n=1 Tax=Micromonospora acroterricola TaxID=2202421 RepID=A0A317D359_9ACTN|nr:STAS domain-containing protein [Micromonospora acroterricola]PWR09017.1 anti-sigma factor antagonist [Micromonospora acroterricola]
MSTEKTWQWHVSAGADGRVVVLSGEIDMSGADRLDDLLHEMIAQAGTVEVDLLGLTFIDSTVLSTLVGAYHHAADRGVDLTLVNAAGQVRRVLDMTGIMQMFGRVVDPPPAAI